MALLGELKGLSGTTCDCGEELGLQVCSSAAGYYLGYFCPNCGPYSRETGYYASRTDAKAELALMVGAGFIPSKVRDTDFRPGEDWDVHIDL